MIAIHEKILALTFALRLHPCRHVFFSRPRHLSGVLFQ
jgi:hypothetical protein